MSDPILFASKALEDQFYGSKLNPLARQIVLGAAEYAFTYHGWLPLVTSVIRTAEEDAALKGSGLHVAGRAVDLRTKNIPVEIVQDVNEYVNGTWVYDQARPNLLVWFDKPHGSGPHAHIQVHAFTKKRKKD